MGEHLRMQHYSNYIRWRNLAWYSLNLSHTWIFSFWHFGVCLSSLDAMLFISICLTTMQPPSCSPLQLADLSSSLNKPRGRQRVSGKPPNSINFLFRLICFRNGVIPDFFQTIMKINHGSVDNFISGMNKKKDNKCPLVIESHNKALTLMHKYCETFLPCTSRCSGSHPHSAQVSPTTVLRAPPTPHTYSHSSSV